MDTEFWLERWKKNEIGFHQREINPYLQAHWGRLNLAPASPVFVPLCGKSADMLWLRARGHPVLGIEISPVAVRDLHTENDLQPRISTQGRFERWETDGLVILRGDFFDLAPRDLSDVAGVYDRAALVALPPPLRARYVGHLRTILPVDAAILLVTMEYPQEQMAGPPFSVTEEEVRGLYESRYAVTHLATKDILDANPRFREQGLSRLVEKIYHLTPRRLN